MFFGAFWQGFGFNQTNANLEQLLKSKKPLEDVLNEETVVNDIRRNPKSFSKYLKENKEEFKKLIDYIIKEPSEFQTDEKKLYKYPFTISEIFSGNNLHEVADFLFDREEENEPSNKSEDSGPINQEQDQEAKMPDLPILPVDDDPTDEDKEEFEEETKVETQVEETQTVPDKIEEKTTTTAEEKTDEVLAATTTTTTDTTTEPSSDPKLQESQTEIQSEKETDQQDALVEKKVESEKNEKENENIQVESKKEEVVEFEENKQQFDQGNKEEVAEISQSGKKPGEEILQYIFQFLETDMAQKYPISAGYFNQLMTILFQKSGYLSLYLNKNPQLRSLLIEKISCKSISDIVSKLFTFDGSDSSDTEIQEARRSMFQDVMSKFQSSQLSDEIENISLILKDIIEGHRNRDGNHFDELFKELQEKSNLEIIIQKINPQDLNTSYYAISIFNDIVMAIGQGQLSFNQDTDLANFDDSDNFLIQDQLKDVLELINLILRNNGSNQLIETTFKQEIPSLGKTKLKIVQLFSNLFRSSLVNSTVFKDFVKSTKFFDFLLNMIYVYEWNNILQTFVEKIIQSVLDRETQKSDDDMLQLFFQSQFIKYMHQLFIDQKAQITIGHHENKISRGNSAFFEHLFQKLDRCSSFPGKSDPIWAGIKESPLMKQITENKEQNLGKGYNEEHQVPIVGFDDFPENKEDNNIDIQQDFQKQIEFEQKETSPQENTQLGWAIFNLDFQQVISWRAKAWDFPDVVPIILKELAVGNKN